ncbi:glycosyltransferase family 4 protein [soil metagenome]
MKKIVIIGPAYPLRGGLASYDERLAKEFINSGYSTIIYTFSLQYPDFLFPGTTQYSSEPAPAGIPIKICINSVNPFNWLTVGNELKKMRPDIVVVRYWLPFMGPCLGTILRKVKKNKFTKVVCIADNILPHEKRIGDNPFTQYFVKPVDAFVTMSEKVLADIKLFSPEKPSKFVPHPLYDNFGGIISKKSAREFLKISDTDNILLFFGFIRKYKGLDLLLEAINILKNSKSRVPNLKLLIAGEFYEDRKIYDELIQKYQLQNDLILHTDFIPDSEVKYYLCAADCVIQPYRSATQSGVTPLAYHFEKPMIVTNVGGLPALVPPNVGMVCEPNPVAIASKIGEYFMTGEEAFLPGIRHEKNKYTWNIMVDAIVNING